MAKKTKDNSVTFILGIIAWIVTNLIYKIVASLFSIPFYYCSIIDITIGAITGVAIFSIVTAYIRSVARKLK